MTYLTLLLLIKISVTFIFVVLPFLFSSKERIEKLIFIQANSPLFIRLYGVAILSLLVGYGSAIPLAQSGVFPWGILLMGLVSNSGASSLMFILGSGKQSRVFAIFFGAIALLLVLAMAFPVTSLQKVW